uniref:CN hydrolase domain-containing protein n=1 Tax=Panagrolaimus superbus TaxID=310955 RepID=A0A914YIL4_9BILA
MRALETGRPMLRATNTGMTAAIDPYGRVRAVLPPLTPVATGVVQQIQLLVTGHTFCHYPQAQLLRHDNHGLSQHQILAAQGQIADIALINLEHIDGNRFRCDSEE